jgi:hypothetical protein
MQEKYVFFYGLLHTVSQLIEALRYKPDDRGFDFSLT